MPKHQYSAMVHYSVPGAYKVEKVLVSFSSSKILSEKEQFFSADWEAARIAKVLWPSSSGKSKVVEWYIDKPTYVGYR